MSITCTYVPKADTFVLSKDTGETMSISSKDATNIVDAICSTLGPCSFLENERNTNTRQAEEIDCAQSSLRIMKDAICGALSISDLWAPSENWSVEHEGEAMALHEMYSQLHGSVADFLDESVPGREQPEEQLSF